jgi:hypothetical protein
VAPIGDATSIEVVGRELDSHPIAEEDADAIPAHFPGRIAEGFVAVVEEDAEHPVPQSLHDLTLHLDLLFLG